MTPRYEPALVDRILSLRDWTLRTSRIVEGRTFEDMEADLILQLAVAKAIEWTGELSGRIVKKWPDFVLDHPDIELKGAYLMRNRLAHGYETVDLLTMWETISIDINRMSERLAAFLATIDEQS